MRLRNAQVILKTNLGNLTPAPHGFSGGVFDLRNRSTILHALTAIRNAGVLMTEVDVILAQPPFTRDSTIVNQDELNVLTGRTNEIRARAEAILEFLNNSLPPAPEYYFSIRFSAEGEHTDSLKDLIGALHLGLDHPIRLLGEAPIRIVAGEPGSLVLEIAVLGPIAITVIGTILSLATRAAKLTQEAEKANQESAKTKQESAKVEQEQEKAIQSRLATDTLRIENRRRMIALQKEALELESTETFNKLAGGQSTSQETVTALGEGSRSVQYLLEKGTRFQLQIDAPAEIARHFPPHAVCRDPGVPEKSLDDTAKKLLAAIEAPDADVSGSVERAPQE